MIGVLIGTRPEMIKMAPVFGELEKRKIAHFFIHSDQHYSDEMDTQIFKDLKLRDPDVHLGVGSGSHAVQTGKILQGVENECLKYHPTILVVHGDTNTTLAGALAAKKLHIKVAHVEAGLRSHDYGMPEEINRILTDRISDILFAPTEIAKENLVKEGITDGIFVVGNTVVDALYQHIPLAKKSRILQKVPSNKSSYILVTAHRAENVDDKGRLQKLLELLEHASRSLSLPLVWPMHPRTKIAIEKFELNVPKHSVILQPVGYIDMLALLQSAEYVLTDSGGIQEEAYILKKQLITLRSSTERPETLSANAIVDLNIEKFEDAISAYKTGKMSWSQVFGDGTAAQKIVDTLEKYV